MQTPPLPPGDPGQLPDAAVPPVETGLGTPRPAAVDGPSTVLRAPAARTDAAPSVAAEEDVLADLFCGEDGKVTDDSPTVITKRPTKPPEDAAGDSLRGRRLAHFELLEPIGVGGMAAVIRARDLQLDRTVALKVLPPEMAVDAENVQRFHQEARSAAKLDHENIARVFYCGEDQQLHFIAFEFVEGENLRMLLERRGRLPVPEALHYMLQIATGLAHAAARGVVHRDIKPSNIIISPNGRAKLVDMGLARMSETKTEKGLTHSGVTLGTFDYISPEQALEPRDADVRSDIYSLGCTFYHALTGMAPVPEGTAAKKLHHHQHEAPIDPRQLNPEISDDMAAILARMMAKDPKARYQRAEHLAQHLLLATRKIEPQASDTSTAPLFIDAPLPDPPRTRPLLVAGLAAMILLITVLFFGRTGKPPEIKDFDPPKSAKAGGKEGTLKNPDIGPRPAPAVESPGPRNPGPKAEPRLIASARELLDFAGEERSADVEIEIILTGASYEFPLANSGDVGAPLRLGGSKISIRAKDPNKKPTIRFTYDVEQLGQLGPGAAPGWLGLFIDGDDVTIENVRFVLDGRGNRDGRMGMAGVFLRGRDLLGTGAPTFLLKQCEFIQAGQPPDLKINRPSSVVLSALNKAARPRLTLEDCYFVGFEEATGDTFKNVKRGGQDAITLKSPAKVVAMNCAFGPHAALVRIEPGAEGSDVALGHCAGLLVGESAAFHVVGEKTTCRIDVQHSWFAGLNAPFPLGPLQWKGAVLLRQDGDWAILYQGKDNRLIGLDAFWVRPMAADPVVADDQKAFQNHDMKEDSVALAANMKLWKEGDPLAALERGEPSKAFQVNERLPDARTRDGKQLVGLWGWGDKIVFKPPIDENPAVPARKVLVVDPDAKLDDQGAYRTLNGAIDKVNADEEVEIQLRFNGIRAVKPVVIEKRIKVTIRPAAGFRPIALLAKSPDLHSHLFRVLDGEVTLDELEFRLQPDESSLKFQAIAEMVGDGKCTFQKCVVTLDPAGKGVPLSVVTISDPEAAQMRMPQTAGKVPRLVFENCLIRGDGDLIACHASRVFEADVTNVWAAISGSLFNGDGSREESAPLEQPAQLRFKQVSAYLVGYLVRLRAVQNFKGVTPVQIESANCVFQAAGGKSLVHLEGPDPGEDRVKTLIGWKAENNVYGGFDFLLDNQPLDDKMPAPPIGPNEWTKREGESHARILKMQVLTPQRPDLPLTQAVPENFRLKADIPLGQGATLDARVRPSSEGPPRSEVKTDE